MVINNEGSKPKGKDLKFRNLGKKPVDMLGHGLGYVGDKIRNKPPVSPADRDVETAVADTDAQRRLAEARLGTGQVNTEQPTTGGEVEPDERDGVRH